MDYKAEFIIYLSVVTGQPFPLEQLNVGATENTSDLRDQEGVIKKRQINIMRKEINLTFEFT